MDLLVLQRGHRLKKEYAYVAFPDAAATILSCSILQCYPELHLQHTPLTQSLRRTAHSPSAPPATNPPKHSAISTLTEYSNAISH